MDFPSASACFTIKPFSINQPVIVVVFSFFRAGVVDGIHNEVHKLRDPDGFLRRIHTLKFFFRIFQNMSGACISIPPFTASITQPFYAVKFVASMQ